MASCIASAKDMNVWEYFVNTKSVSRMQFLTILVKYFWGFSHHDVATRYHTAYMHLAYKPNTPVHITAAFDHLVRNDPTCPKLKVPIPDDMPYSEKLIVKPALERLKNDDKSCVELTQIDGMYSQISHLLMKKKTIMMKYMTCLSTW